MMLGYPGQFDAYLGRFLSWWRGKPMALDLYMSLYLIAVERGLVAKSPFTGELIRRLEQLGLYFCDVIICDTEGYRTYHHSTYATPKDKFRFVPAGADERLFYPRQHVERDNHDQFVVAYHGTFLPSHGIETIIETAELLQTQSDIHFLFFGTGPEEEKIRQLVSEKGLTNVTFSGWIERNAMANELATVDICLGVFGTTKQSRITVQNKIWEGLAMALPVISGASPTVSETLVDREEIYLVERENPADLARAITDLQQNESLRQRLAQQGFQKFSQHHTLHALGSQLQTHLMEVVAR